MGPVHLEDLGMAGDRIANTLPLETTLADWVAITDEDPWTGVETSVWTFTSVQFNRLKFQRNCDWLVQRVVVFVHKVL